MSLTEILSIAGALVLGLGVAYINMLISRASYRADSVGKILGGSSARYLLDAAALAITYFVCKAHSFPMTACLLACALALTVGGMAFLRMMVKKTQPHDSDTADGGE